MVIISRRMTWAGHVARTGQEKNAYKILVAKPGKPRRRWEDNIRMGLREVGWEGVDRIFLAQKRDR
jgi:hypothetical protein